MSLRIAHLVAGVGLLSAPLAMAQAPYSTPGFSTAPAPSQPSAPGSQRPDFAYGDWHNPGAFAAQVREQENDITREIRHEVRHGAVSPRVWGAVNGQRQLIDQNLANISQKGFVSHSDRRNVEQQIQSLRQLEDQYRTNPGYGGYRG